MSMAKIKLAVVIPGSMVKRVISTIARARKTSVGIDIKVLVSVVEKVTGYQHQVNLSRGSRCLPDPSTPLLQ
jgi:nitrogen regulatory protein PII